MSVTSIDLNLREKLKNQEYRCVFFETKLADEVAHDLRSIREAHSMRQSDLAKKSGMKQTAISRIERSDEANWNIKTLLRLALALDCRLKVVFQPIDEAINEVWPEDKNIHAPSLSGWVQSPALLPDTTSKPFFAPQAGYLVDVGISQAQPSGGFLANLSNRRHCA